MHTVDGDPLPEVTIALLDHPEHGTTRTFADGGFTMVARGGGSLVVTYEADGFLPAARRIDVPWQGYAQAPDVVLVPLDPQVTPIDLDTAPPYAEARGSVVTDADGTRQATVLFPPGTTADLLFPDGTLQPISTLSLRATEYTVGARGPAAMPGELPPTSGYTYAVELSADEALAAGAVSVVFNQAIPFYVDNFLGFPAGTVVPMGYYDRARAAWIPSENGRVVEIVEVSGSLAVLDTNGDGEPDDSATLDALGITPEEQAKLAALYAPGHSLWRVPIQHFTPWDANWPYGFPADACVPLSLTCSMEGGEGEGDGGGDESRDPDRSEPEPSACEERGSIIDCENQVLGEALPIAGTPFSLHYRSDRAAGHGARSTLTIPLARGGVPASVKRIELHIDIAGRHMEQSFACPCAPSSETTFSWDGKDAFGRETQGEQPITVRIGYAYEGVYQAPRDSAPAFGAFASEDIAYSRTRSDVIAWKRWQGRLGGLTASALGLGGWTVDVHHVYSPSAEVLYLGDGRRRTGAALGTELRTVAGKGGTTGALGDGGPAVSAPLDTVSGVAVGPDGSVYLSSTGQARVRRVDPEGLIWPVAGTGVSGGGGDGGPALQAQVQAPRGLALGSDGSLYVAEQGGHRVRKIAVDGTITTVAGNGTAGFSGDGGPATQAQLRNPFSVAVTEDGTLFIADTQNHRIRRVGLDGTITTVAGTGTAGFSGDGGLATEARLGSPRGVVVARDGGLFVVDHDNHRIRQVDRRGRITSFAGTGVAGTTGDGGPARAARLRNPTAAVLDGEGTLYVADSTGYLIRRITPAGVIHPVAGTGSCCDVPLPEGERALVARVGTIAQLALGPDGGLYTAEMVLHRVRRIARSPLPGVALTEVAIPTEDARKAYVFSGTGRHLRTIEVRTGATLLGFQYDPAGLLTAIQDGDGALLTISRGVGGMATALTGAFGQTTTLSVDGEGLLAVVRNPAGESDALGYDARGLLTRRTDALGREHSFAYDNLGRLTQDSDPAGGSKSLTRSGAGSGRAVSVTTALGRSTTYAVQRPGAADVQRSVTNSAGLMGTKGPGADGQTAMLLPDGRTVRWSLAPDPVFGMLAPYRKQESVTTPGGRTLTVTRARSAMLSNPADPSSFTSLQDMTNINGKLFVDIYQRNTRTTTRTTPAGRSFVTTMDLQGRVEQIVVAGMHPVQLTYGPHGRLDAMTQGMRTITHAYGPHGFRVSTTDPLGQVEGFVVDPVGRVQEALRPDGDVVLYGHDLVGNLVSVTPPGRPAHSFGYNAVDLRASYTPPPPAAGGTTSTQWGHDLDGQLATTTLPGGATLTHARDAAGRLAELTFAGGAVARTYHPTTGKLATITGPAGVDLTFSHDGELLTSVTWTGVISGTIHQGYDNNLKLAQEQVNGGHTVVFGRDLDGLLTSAGPLTFTRDPQKGLLTRITIGHVVETLSHDAYGEIVGRSVMVDGFALMTVAYSRDLLGRIVEKTETLSGITHVTGYDYDLAGRLREVYLDSSLALHIDHDENGNHLARVTPDAVVEGHFDAQDRLLSQGDLTFTFDDAGTLQNRIDTATGDTTNYSYDDLGNLRQVMLPGGTLIDYVVDGLGRRVGKRIGGALSQGWLYRDKLQPAAELGPTGAVVAHFIYGDRINVPEVMVREGAVYRLITDHVGSVRLVVHVASGFIAQRIEYDEFGRVLLDTNPGFQPFGFAGGLYDHDTSLVRFGARDYDAETGRWTSKDPLLFEGGDTNLYAYAAGDPNNFADPTGHVAIAVIAPMLAPAMEYLLYVIGAGILVSSPTTPIEDVCAWVKPYVDPSWRDKCAKIKDICIDDCCEAMSPYQCDGSPYHRCMKECLDQYGCWGIQY
ncbi:RHS repeat-associated core domain-containing protein [Chondromyces crocatus]|uniref:NHL domain-containing protein n=1 Tax=Chondromyces crocatus TaxID=52 RepID=UPI0012E2DB62|nr:RHS repeat-associated core domain-containing protein [Chondromyces crocatus]